MGSPDASTECSSTRCIKAIIAPSVGESKYLPRSSRRRALIIRSSGNLITGDPAGRRAAHPSRVKSGHDAPLRRRVIGVTFNREVSAGMYSSFWQPQFPLRSSLHRSRRRPTVGRGDTRYCCAMMAWFSNDLEDGYERTRYRCNSDDRVFAAGTCIRRYL
jgi:hypothetical protein